MSRSSTNQRQQATEIGGAAGSRSSSGFKYLRKGECPICSGAKVGCRESKDSGKIHCRSGLPAPSGWRETGVDAHGFVMYAEGEGQSDPREFERRRLEREQRQQQQARRTAESLPTQERDRQFRQIAKHSGLSTKHRQNLLNRGYTVDQIDRAYSQGLLWTWADGAAIPGISADLPGVDASGNLRYLGGGMAIGVLNEQGQIIGVQIRPDKGGYFWTSSEKIGGNSSHLQNGEMPIGLYLPINGVFKSEIDIGEGFLKSHLTAQLHGRLVIGAAGGNFAGSAIQIESSLAAAAALTGSKLVVLNADAGSLSNSHILSNYTKLAKFATDLGYEFRVRWYDQTTKEVGDSDEISNKVFESAQLLTFAEFLELAPKPESGQGFKSVDGGKSEDEPKSDRERTIARLLFDFNQGLPLLDKDRKITRKDDTERDVAYYEGRTPEFSKVLTDGMARTILIRGFLAAGKTYAAIESIKRMVTELGTYKQFVWISTRNGLLRQSEARLLSKELGIPIYFYQQDVTRHRQLMESRKPGIFIMTDASFSNYHVGRVDWSNITVFVDEWASVRSQIPSKTKCFPEFKRMLSDARVLVVLDAFLGDVDCRILTKFRQGERLILDQVPTKAPKNIRWAECRNRDGEISFSHDGIAVSVFDSWFKGRSLEEDERYILVADSLLTAKVMQLYVVKELGLKESEVLLICSETVELSHSTMSDPDGKIRNSGAKLVILTPTAESGIDIQVPFTAGLAMFCGVLSGTSAMQLMGRARQCNDWIVSAPRRSINPDQPYLSEAKFRRILTRLSETFEESGMSSDAGSDGWAVWQREIRAMQSAFNSQYIYHLLVEHYESVATTEEFGSDSKRWIEFVQKVKAADAQKALTADLQNGSQMLEDETPPSKDQHVWDLRLAKGYQEHPKLWAAAMSDFKNGCGLERTEAIAWARELLKEKELASLKRYVQAADCDLDDDNALNDRVARVGSNYSSPAFKQLQNQSLFRALNLESLAQMGYGDKVEADGVDVEAFDARSPKIQALWKKFQSIPRLVRLFPTVETVQDFWRAIKLCMRYFGFQAESGTARAEREGKKPSMYFVGWVIRAESGSKFFVQNFDLIIESVRDRLEVERLERRRGNSHTHDSGQQWRAAA